MSQQEAAESHSNVQNAYILPPDDGIMVSPYSATHYEHSHVWSPTIFDTPLSNHSYGVQAQNSFLFTQQQQQMAADWQQRMAQVNQSSPWYVQQQQYLSQLVGPTDHRQTLYKYRI
jgi:hypothetical protein